MSREQPTSKRAGAARHGCGKSPPRREPDGDLIGAYREGLAVAAVLIIAGAAAVRIIVADHRGEAVPGPGEAIQRRWWCRRSGEAECLAAAAMRSLRRAPNRAGDPARLAGASIVRAAARLAISLRTDEDLRDEALQAIARLDDEFEKQKQSGALKSLNSSYRRYRLEASARSERAVRYAEWIKRYKLNLIREIAANLRSF